MGRRVFENLRKAVGYIISIHVPLAGLTFLPVVFGWPSILGPVHIAFLELIIDPACSIAFEAEGEESDLMRRPPRAASDRLFEFRLVRTSLLSGTGALLILLAIFSFAFYRGQGEADARALTFTSLVLMNLALILTNRSRSRSLWETVRTPNAAMWWIVCGALVFLAVTWYVPSVTALFRFSTLHLHDAALCLAAGLAGLVWFEAVKRFERT